jgi:hypothetical protein
LEGQRWLSLLVWHRAKLSLLVGGGYSFSDRLSPFHSRWLPRVSAVYCYRAIYSRRTAANHSLQLTRLACGKLLLALPARMP